MEKVKVWLDCDTGVDDATAIICACNLDQLEIVGASATMGNVELESTFKNTRNVLSLAHHEQVKVYPGALLPLSIEYVAAHHVHGKDGLDGAVIPESKAEVEKMAAWDALYEKAKELGEELKVVATGPLTNIATALIRHPDITDYISQIYVMGGGVARGNVTPHAEFNFYCDPHAARIVFDSKLHVHMFGLDVTELAYISYDETAMIASFESPYAKLFSQSNNRTANYCKQKGEPGIHQHDSCPVMYLAYPELFKGVDCHMHVVDEPGETLGKSVVDEDNENINCTYYNAVNRENFAGTLISILKSY